MTQSRVPSLVTLLHGCHCAVSPKRALAPWRDVPRLAPGLAPVGRDRVEDVVVARRVADDARARAVRVRVVAEVRPDDVQVARRRRPSSRRTSSRRRGSRSEAGTGSLRGQPASLGPVGMPPMQVDDDHRLATRLPRIVQSSSAGHFTSRICSPSVLRVVVGERDVDRPVRADDRVRALVVEALDRTDAFRFPADLDPLRPRCATVRRLAEEDRVQLADSVREPSSSRA